MKKISFLGALSALTTVGILQAQPAIAQGVGTESPNEDIVVTARRRAEDPQKVPIALAVFGGGALERAGISGLNQLKQQAPGLQIIGNNARNTNVTIRGLGSSIGLVNDGLEGGVGVYIDDVYYSRSGQAMFDLIDLDRIEVLRGPQGTLFGKNTTGGALSIYTRKPSLSDREMFGEATVGDHGVYQLRGAVSTPLVEDRVAARITVAQTWRNGFVHNRFTGKRSDDLSNFTGRGQLLIRPVDGVTVRLIGDYGLQRIQGPRQVTTQVLTTNINGNPIPNGFYARAARTGYVPPNIDPFARVADLDLDTGTYTRMSQWGLSGKLDWDMGGHSLTSITAYREWKWNPVVDADGTGLPVITAAGLSSRQHQFTQEMRLSSTGDRNVDYVVGLFYYFQNITSNSIVQYGPAAPLWIFPGEVPFTRAQQNAGLIGFGAMGVAVTKTRSYAAFGQATWHITDALGLTGGLRYTRETKDGDFAQQVGGGVDLSTLPTAVAVGAQAVRNNFAIARGYSAHTKEGKLSGSVNLSYQITPTILTYANYARGFKSGGVNTVDLSPGVPTTVAPEKITAYEVGLKSRLFDRMATLNIAAFWTEDKNFQASLQDFVRTLSYIANVGTVRSRGIEVETTIRPNEHLSAYVSAAYTDAEYTSYTDAPCPLEYQGTGQTVCNLSGTALPGVSKWSLATGGEFSHPIGSGSTLFYVGADYSYRTHFYSTPNRAAFSRIGGYGLTNGRIGFRAENDRWDISAWVRNLFDTKYLTTASAGAFNTGQVIGFIGDPRTVGVTGRFRY